MNIHKLVTALDEAERFMEKAGAALNIMQTGTKLHMARIAITGCKETAACRRASLDLSRALSDLRRKE